MTPLTQTKLLSFKDNFKELVNLSLRNKLPNKLIFSGNKGIGKSTFAFHFLVEIYDMSLVPFASDSLIIVNVLSWLDFDCIRCLVHDAPATVERLFEQLW